MNIPAMDATRSKRFGYLSTDSANIATIMHDEKVPNRNHGEAWRVTQPVYIKTDNIVDVVSTFEDNKYTKNNFSIGFWNQVAKIYRVVSPNFEDTGENTEIKYKKNTKNSFEAHFLHNIVHTLNSCGPSSELWYTVLEDAQWNRIEDSETGDINLFGDDNRTFKESSFKDVEYIPSVNQVDEWGLYCYSIDYQEQKMNSLWIRMKDNSGDVVEYPLIEDNEMGAIVSIKPDFGSLESNHISKEAQEALENQFIGGESNSEERLTDLIGNMDLCSKTEYVINNATESTDIN